MTKSLIAMVFAGLTFAFIDHKPTLFIIGDSTVRNTTKPGDLWGWGSVIDTFFDAGKINISNQAMAGRSTRTFTKEGRWKKVVDALKEGDFVMMQFGHNDGSRPDTSRSGNRGVLRGTGEDSVILTWPDGTLETVHSYGWYLRQFIRQTKAKGANPIVLSFIPRNDWKNGKVIRPVNSFGQYAAQVAKEEGAWFIDLNSITADKYDAMGEENVKPLFPKEHTHTSEEGARINAASVIDGLKRLGDCSLNNYLRPV